MAVRDWINGFLERHKARFDPHDWPAADAVEEMREYARTWITALSLKEIGEKEADEASRRLAFAPPNFRREHIPMVVQAVEQIRAERNPRDAPEGTREAARYNSRHCEYCGGEGLAAVWHVAPDPEHRVAPTAAAYCVCQHGRWIKRVHAEKEPELLRRIPDLDHVLHGAGVYLPNPPEYYQVQALGGPRAGTGELP